ncbi:surface lipoprotein assembly modifier, partial [Acinetobacter nectaris]|uniref:surface lipoprotein assembly modifier n=1 Tax=Acinetobacter nectaris TaxID=1219382 RepID=UPI001F3DFBFA
QEWHPNFNFSYERTDNVNQSSNIREIILNGAKFVRNKGSLPQKAQGIDYALGIFHEKNIIKNSYLNFSISLDGISYWDNKDYSEQTWNSSIGYTYKDVHQSWGVTPFIQQNMLGDSRYSLNYGTTLDYSRQLSNRLKFVVSSTYLQKNYKDSNIANHYNGTNNGQTALLLYQLKSNVLIYTGIDYIQDRLSDKSESSIKTGIRTGFLYLSSPINVRTNIRYAKRNFKADNVWYKEKRKDSEYELGMSIWHQQWQWKGFTPKLNYKYQKIDSNLPLYERNNNSWFITIDKNF